MVDEAGGNDTANRFGGRFLRPRALGYDIIEMDWLLRLSNQLGVVFFLRKASDAIW